MLWASCVTFRDDWPDPFNQVSPALSQQICPALRLYQKSGFLTLFTYQQRRADFGMLCHLILESDWIGLLPVEKDDDIIDPSDVSEETW